MSAKKTSAFSKTLSKGQNPTQILTSEVGTVEEYNDFPLLVLPKMVLFPGHSFSISSLEGLKREEIHLAQKGLLRIGVVTSLEESENSSHISRIEVTAGSTPSALAPMFSSCGTEAVITGLIKLSDGGFGAILKGIRRCLVTDIVKKKTGYVGKVIIPVDKAFRHNSQYLASVKALKNIILKILKLNPAISQDTMAFLYTSDDPAVMCDLITPYLSISTKEKLAILGSFDLRLRVKQVLKHLAKEVELLQISTRIQEEVRFDLQDNLKRSFLREQMAAIKRELGEIDGDVDEVEDIRAQLDKLKIPKEVLSIISREVDRLGMMHPGSPEYMVSWNYLTWVKDLPWDVHKKEGEAPTPLPKIPLLDEAARTLNKSHYGLKKVKERILEYIAVLHHHGQIKGQILLLVGPPGVGKTSLVSGMAKALNRPFTRISLGGVKDEAEIRGHRRTYIGALPGKIIQAIKEAKSTHAVILLDEIDKVGGSYSGVGNMQGDLSSALLEVLDQEQNKTFTDHYLGFPFDLSNILFVATANSAHSMSPPLLDRMEILDIGGYTEREKQKIAKSHLMPALCKDLSLSEEQFHLGDDVLEQVVRFYTREAGVRQLKRELMTIGRKIVKKIVEVKGSDKTAKIEVNKDNLYTYLGHPHYMEEPNDLILPPGVAIGLAYTPMGGDILYIESRKSLNTEGRGALTLTGSLGTVMKESAHTAQSFLISRAHVLGIDLETLQKSSIHLHLPDGATPKDGPSAGVAILCALTGLFLDKSISSQFAMTGEITLRGQVLPVGGIKEKLLAAHRYGKKFIIMPHKNWADLHELPLDVLKDLSFYPVRHMFEALLITDLVKSSLATKPKAIKYKKMHKDNFMLKYEEFDVLDQMLI